MMYWVCESHLSNKWFGDSKTFFFTVENVTLMLPFAFYNLGEGNILCKIETAINPMKPKL